MTTKKELHLLSRVATYIYGPRWQVELARDLKINERTVRAWLSGLYTVNPNVWFKLLDRFDRKMLRAPIIRQRIRKFIREIEKRD